MLKVGTDTYLTLSEADGLLTGRPGSESWMMFHDAQKEDRLKRAAQHLEALHYAGRKHSIFQDMAFPRDLSRSIPVNIKLAQALEALALPDTAGAQNPGEPAREPTMYSMEAASLLRPYLLGSHRPG